MKLSFENYRETCNEAFRVNMINPTIYWDAEGGFYVAPSRDLIPNDDLRLGLAYYSANHGDRRSFMGTRREYRPVARAIRAYHSLARRTKTLQDFVDYAVHEANVEADIEAQR